MKNAKNIIIFIVIAGALFALYTMFLKPADNPDEALLTTPASLPGIDEGSPTPALGSPNPVAADFLSLLLNVKNIRLGDSVLADPVFKNLKDSSIVLIHDNTEGRPNPFARLGDDRALPPSSPTLDNDRTLAPDAGDTAADAGTGADFMAEELEGLGDALDDLDL